MGFLILKCWKYVNVNCEEYEQEALNILKYKILKIRVRSVNQNWKYWKTNHSWSLSHYISLTQENKINVELIKKIKTIDYKSTLENQDSKTYIAKMKFKGDQDRVNQ